MCQGQEIRGGRFKEVILIWHGWSTGYKGAVTFELLLRRGARYRKAPEKLAKEFWLSSCCERGALTEFEMIRAMLKKNHPSGQCGGWIRKGPGAQ